MIGRAGAGGKAQACAWPWRLDLSFLGSLYCRGSARTHLLVCETTRHRLLGLEPRSSPLLPRNTHMSMNDDTGDAMRMRRDSCALGLRKAPALVIGRTL